MARMSAYSVRPMPGFASLRVEYRHLFLHDSGVDHGRIRRCECCSFFRRRDRFRRSDGLFDSDCRIADLGIRRRR